MGVRGPLEQPHEVVDPGDPLGLLAVDAREIVPVDLDRALDRGEPVEIPVDRGAALPARRRGPLGLGDASASLPLLTATQYLAPQ